MLLLRLLLLLLLLLSLLLPLLSLLLLWLLLLRCTQAECLQEDAKALELFDLRRHNAKLQSKVRCLEEELHPAPSACVEATTDPANEVLAAGAAPPAASRRRPLEEVSPIRRGQFPLSWKPSCWKAIDCDGETALTSAAANGHAVVVYCLRVEAEARAEVAQRELLEELSAPEEGDRGKSRQRKRKTREQLEADPAGDHRLASLRIVAPPQQSTADSCDEGGETQGELMQGDHECPVVVPPITSPDADALLRRVRELEDLAVHKDQHIHILEERCAHLGDQCAELSRLNQEVYEQLQQSKRDYELISHLYDEVKAQKSAAESELKKERSKLGLRTRWDVPAMYPALAEALTWTQNHTETQISLGQRLEIPAGRRIGQQHMRRRRIGLYQY